MSSWKEVIEDVTGSVGDDTFISDVCSQSLAEVVSSVDDKHLKGLIVAVATDDSNPIGLPDDSGKLVDVFREDGISGRFRECKEVPLSLESRLQDGGSIYAATKNEPLFVRHSGSINVYPAPAADNGVKVYYLDTDIAIAHGGSYDSTPAEFNVALKPAILYKAIHRTLTKLMLGIANSLPSQPFINLPSPPAPPVGLVFGTTGDLDISSLSVPLFVPPPLSLSYADIDTALADEDEDMAVAHTGRLNMQMEEYNGLVTEATNQFEESTALFDKQFEELKHNADKGVDKLDKEAANNIDIFGKEMDVYKEHIDKEINYFKELISKKKEQYTIYKDSSDIYKELYLELIKQFLPEDKKDNA